MEHNYETKHSTVWSRILVAYLLLTVAMTGIEIVPLDNIFVAISVLVLVGVYIVLWLSFPFILYKDRKYVVKHTDWKPSKAYYVGWLPGYLGMLAIILYLSRRHKRLEEEENIESRQTDDEDENNAFVVEKDEVTPSSDGVE